jgi:predicted MPP superfamily phosphohydrolase
MINRRQFLQITKRLVKGTVAVGTACLADAYFYERHFPVVETNVLRLRGLSEAWRGTRVVQLTDLHLEPFTTAADITRAVNLANSLEPDLILITGDFMTKEWQPVAALAELLSDLRAPLGIYGCLGNHDHWHRPDAIQKELERRQIGILRNEGTVLLRHGQPMFLAGVDSAWGGAPNFGKATAAHRLGDPLLLMVHEPDFALQVVPTGRVSAQLSGHTHGGQVRVPGFSPPFLPKLGKRFAAGSYDVGDTSLYVSRGIGCIGLPLRFASAPEVTLHVLEPKREGSPGV